MKKKYVPPESKLLVINIKENISASGGMSEVSGVAVIKFTQEIDGCRALYFGNAAAPVKTSGTAFTDYYNELVSYGAEAYFNCFRYQFG